MQKLLKIFIVFLITAFTASCQKNLKINDIIQPINIVAGKTDSVIISDIFYAQKYDLDFNKNENVNIKMNESKLYLTADSSFEGLALLEFEADMNIYQIPIISTKEKYFGFSFKPDETYDKLTLFGSFNGWNRTELPMKDNNNDGIFEAKVSLEPGVYQYKFFGDGEEIVDPNNSEKVSNGMGSFNSIRTIEEKNSKKLFLHVKDYKNGNSKINLQYNLEYDSDMPVKQDEIFALLDNSRIDSEQILIDNNTIEVVIDRSEFMGEHTFRIAVSKDGRVSNFQTVKLFDGKPASNSNFTWNDAIIYSLMIDRFNDGDSHNSNPVEHDSLSDKANYNGGDLQGVLSKITDGYFESLGINTLWISPVYDNPNKAYKEYPAPHRYYSGYHGYWPISSKGVDEHFGNLDHVKKVVSESHKKGIKVLLDFVSNHVHTEHSYFTEHRDWFGQLELPDGRLNLRFWDEFRLTTWFEPYLASFDYLGSEEALEEMTDVAVWWLKETGADGYRHDAVKHVPNLFWRRLNEKLKINIESEREVPVYQIGETFGSYDLISSYVNNGQLHSQFNFNLYDVALPTFIRENASFSTLDKEMHKTFSVYGVNHLMGNVMDSHDKNRFMAFADGDLDASEWSAIEQGWNNSPMVDNPENYKKLVLYIAYMNTIPGLPVIYYGSEFGMSGASDPDNRRMMRFDDDLSNDEKNTLSAVKSIINLRKEHTALRHGDFYTLQADENIYAYIRSDMNERILVVINKSNESQNIIISIPSSYGVGVLVDLITNDTYNYSNKISLDLSKMDFRVFKLSN